MRQMIRARSEAAMRRPGPVAKALRAAATAQSISVASPSAQRASTSPVAGFGVLKVLPLAAGDHFPWISSLFARFRKAATARLIFGRGGSVAGFVGRATVGLRGARLGDSFPRGADERRPDARLFDAGVCASPHCPTALNSLEVAAAFPVGDGGVEVPHFQAAGVRVMLDHFGSETPLGHDALLE